MGTRLSRKISQLQAVVLGIVVLFSGAVSAQDMLSGGGASLPNPLFQKMIEEYHFEQTVTVNYAPVGSAHGYRGLASGKYSYAASEIPQSVLAPNQSKNYVFIPVTIGAVSLVYNLPGNPVLKFTPKLIQEILNGEVRYWDDPKLQALNLSITLPHIPIKRVGRGRRSGTYFLLSAFLKRYGLALDKEVELELVSSNDQLGDVVQKTRGAVGFTEWHFAKRYDLAVGAILNRSGAYVIPNLNSIRAAALTVDGELALSELGLLDTSISDAYPICGYSWLLTHRKQDKLRSFEEAQSLVRWLSWKTHQGQLLAEEMNYPALPYPLLKLIEKELSKITHSGIVLF